MASLATTSLSPAERRAVDRFVGLLQEEFGSDLRAVWLYGSRARGERAGPESDVDVLVVAARARLNDDLRVIELANKAAEAEGLNPVFFSAKLYHPDLIAQRREIRSFFFQEVDRDKIALFGDS